MDYKKLITDILNHTKDEKKLRRIYLFIKVLVEE